MDDIHPWESPWSGEEPSCGSVVFFCRRHRSSFALSLLFCRVLELAGFSIGVVDRGIFSLPKLLARTVLIRPHLHHCCVFVLLFFLSLFLAIDHLVLALSFWCCLDPLRPALGARKQDNLLVQNRLSFSTWRIFSLFSARWWLLSRYFAALFSTVFP